MADVLPFNQNESRRRRDQSEKAKAGRKLLAEWRRVVEDAIRSKRLIATDGRTADALMNFKSSTMSGYLWAAQATLGEKLGASVSTVDRSWRRLKRAGFLDVRKRGTGRSAICVFCIDGEPIFVGAKLLKIKASDPASVQGQDHSNPASVQGLDPASVQGQAISDPARMTYESYKSSESYKAESEQRPPPPPAYAARPQGQPRKRASVQAVQNQLVQRLGNGDVEQGWLLFDALDELDRKQLERLMHDGGSIDDALLNEYRMAAAKRLRETTAQGGAR
jgi:hypothetical protein